MFRSQDHLQVATLFLAKVTFLKHSLINFLILTGCCGSMPYCVNGTPLWVRLTVCVVWYAA